MSWIFINPYGIGDVYFLCALSKSFLETHGGDKIQIHSHKNHIRLQKLFPDRVELLPLKDFSFDFRKFNRLERGSPFLAHPNYALPKESGIDTLGGDNSTLLNLYRKLLFLPENTPLLEPMIPEDSRINAEKRAVELKLKRGQTAILAPECRSLPSISESLWKDWILDLRREGYDTYLLTQSSESKTYRIPHLNCPLDEMIPLAEWCGRVVSIRSGICDLLSTANCRLTVLYPDLTHFSGTLFTAYSLKRMGLSQRVEEKVFRENQWQDP